jgi:Flp pilus assembly CpaE family ATPase
LAIDALNRALLPTEVAPRSKLARNASAIFHSAFGTSKSNE